MVNRPARAPALLILGFTAGIGLFLLLRCMPGTETTVSDATAFDHRNNKAASKAQIEPIATVDPGARVRMAELGQGPQDTEPSADSAVLVAECWRAENLDRKQRIKCTLEAWKTTGRPDWTALAEHLCSTLESAEAKNALVAALIEFQISTSGGTLDLLNDIYEQCKHFRVDDLYASIVKWLRIERPDLYAALLSELLPQTIFPANGGMAVIRLAAVIAVLDGDDYLKSMLEAGSRGELGGTSNQIDAAVLAASGLQDSPLEVLQHVRAVLDSKVLPEDTTQSGIGATMGLLSISKRLDDCMDSAARSKLIRDVLLDKRFMLGASAQIVRNHERNVPPCNIQVADWNGVYEIALGITQEWGMEF